MNTNIVIVVGVIFVLFIVGVVSYFALSGEMGYSRNPFPRLGLEGGSIEDCSSPCSCMPKEVSCDKGTEFCRRKSKFYDQGQFCGEICRACGESTSYEVSQPSIPAHSVDVTLAKSGSLPFTSPFGVGKPPIVYPFPNV